MPQIKELVPNVSCHIVDSGPSVKNMFFTFKDNYLFVDLHVNKNKFLQGKLTPLIPKENILFSDGKSYQFKFNTPMLALSFFNAIDDLIELSYIDYERVTEWIVHGFKKSMINSSQPMLNSYQHILGTLNDKPIDKAALPCEPLSKLSLIQEAQQLIRKHIAPEKLQEIKEKEELQAEKNTRDFLDEFSLEMQGEVSGSEDENSDVIDEFNYDEEAALQEALRVTALQP